MDTAFEIFNTITGRHFGFVRTMEEVEWFYRCNSSLDFEEVTGRWHKGLMGPASDWFEKND